MYQSRLPDLGRERGKALGTGNWELKGAGYLSGLVLLCPQNNTNQEREVGGCRKIPQAKKEKKNVIERLETRHWKIRNANGYLAKKHTNRACTGFRHPLKETQ